MIRTILRRVILFPAILFIWIIAAATGWLLNDFDNYREWSGERTKEWWYGMK